MKDQRIASNEDLKVRAEAIDLDDYNNLAIARAIQNTSIWQSGSNTDISAYAKAQTTYAYGLDKSLLSLEGGSAKNVNIEAKTEVFGWDPHHF